MRRGRSAGGQRRIRVTAVGLRAVAESFDLGQVFQVPHVDATPPPGFRVRAKLGEERRDGLVKGLSLGVGGGARANAWSAEGAVGRVLERPCLEVLAECLIDVMPVHLYRARLPPGVESFTEVGLPEGPPDRGG